MSSRSVSVAVVGVGLVGSEFVRQLQALRPPHPFRLVSLSNSKTTVFNPDGIPPSADWRALLQASPTSTSPGPGGPADLVPALAPLVRNDNAVVFVDNTASASVAETYPALLRAGVHVITPNKKAFSGAQSLYDQIVDASREGGARFLHEATVGAGLPVLSTLKDLVATGDKVRACIALPVRLLFPLLSPVFPALRVVGCGVFYSVRGAIGYTACADDASVC